MGISANNMWEKWKKVEIGRLMQKKKKKLKYVGKDWPKNVDLWAQMVANFVFEAGSMENKMTDYPIIAMNIWPFFLE